MSPTATTPVLTTKQGSCPQRVRSTVPVTAASHTMLAAVNDMHYKGAFRTIALSFMTTLNIK